MFDMVPNVQGGPYICLLICSEDLRMHESGGTEAKF